MKLKGDISPALLAAQNPDDSRVFDLNQQLNSGAERLRNQMSFGKRDRHRGDTDALTWR